MANISPEILSMLNAQFAHENYNANLYAKISNYLSVMGLENIAKFFGENQVEEERKHQSALKSYIDSRNERLKVQSIPEVNVEFTSVTQIAELYLQTEQLTTQRLKDIAEKCLLEMDFLTFKFMQEMLEWQHHEEEEALRFLDRARLAGDNPQTLLLWDANFSM